ncbi:hypothetical protein ACF0H5_021854 [Mactra antiquata]
MYLYTLMLFAIAGSSYSATTPATPGGGHLPSGPELDHLMTASFNNVDSDQDGFIEYYEFDTLIIVADTDNDGCMTLDEYKGFSAGTPAIASKIYQHFDPDNSNCLTVEKIADQFALMDTDKNQKVTLTEFKTYYTELLKTIFNDKDTTVG